MQNNNEFFPRQTVEAGVNRWDWALLPLVLAALVLIGFGASQMALIFASDPGRIRCQLSVQLPRPRDPDSADVRALVDEVYALMTAGAGRRASAAAEQAAPSALGERLPEADVARMDGLIDLLADGPFDGRADLPRLAEDAELTDGELLPVAHALDRLGLARLDSGDLQLTPLGRRYAEGAHGLRQDIFGQQVLAHVPLAAHIRHSLVQAPGGQLSDRPFLRLLNEQLDASEAERTLGTVITWGRHGGVFEYDYTTGMIRLPRRDDDGREGHA